MGIAVEKLGIFDDLQSKGIRYLPKPRLVHGGRIVNRSAIEEAARQAVDEAIAEAVARQIARRRAEIDALLSQDGPSTEAILGAVCQATGFTEEGLRGHARDRGVARARWLFWYIAGALRRDLSLPVLGKLMGNKDHTTCLNGMVQFKEYRLKEPLLTYCAHPAVTEYLAEADKRPRR